jgi:inositol transport system substrate-binding protein
MSVFTACAKEETPAESPSEASEASEEASEEPSEASEEPSEETAPAAEVKEYNFAMSLATQSSQWWTVYADMLVSAIDAVNAGGEYHIEYTLIHNDSAADQVESVQTQIVDQPDIMLMSPIDLDTSVSAVEACDAEGIPVVTTCRESNTDKVTAARVYNEPQFAINQLEALNKDFPDGAKIVYLFGPNTASYAQIQYNDGLMATLPNYPNLELLETFEDEQDTQEVGVKLADDAITKYGDEIDAIAATNDGLAIGAVQAVKAAGYDGEIIVYGSSALPQGMVAIRDGYMAFTNMKSQAIMAETAIQLCLDVLEGRDYEEYGLVDPVPIDKSNVETIRDATFGGTISDPATFDFDAY